MQQRTTEERPAAQARYIRWFKDISIGDVPVVGGKNASLGEMYRELSGEGVKVPNGFTVTAEGYWHMISATGIRGGMEKALDGHGRSISIRLNR